MHLRSIGLTLTDESILTIRFHERPDDGNQYLVLSQSSKSETSCVWIPSEDISRIAEYCEQLKSE